MLAAALLPGLSGTTFRAIAVGTLASLLLIVSVSDVRTRRIPNVLVVCLAIAGVAFSLAADPSLRGAGRALAGMALGFALWFPLYAFRALGAGDVKFFAAASAWLGPATALRAALLAMMFGGVLSLVWLAATRKSRAGRFGFAGGRARVPAVEGRIALASKSDRVPYGVAMAVGVATAAWFPNLLS